MSPTSRSICTKAFLVISRDSKKFNAQAHSAERQRTAQANAQSKFGFVGKKSSLDWRNFTFSAGFGESWARRRPWNTSLQVRRPSGFTGPCRCSLQRAPRLRPVLAAVFFRTTDLNSENFRLRNLCLLYSLLVFVIVFAPFKERITSMTAKCDRLGVRSSFSMDYEGVILLQHDKMLVSAFSRLCLRLYDRPEHWSIWCWSDAGPAKNLA